MENKRLNKIISYLVKQGLATINKNCKGQKAEIDFIAIFSRNKLEFKQLLKEVQPLGKEVDRQTAKTGHTFKLNKPIKTKAGALELVKVRIPDPTRPQRGAPDFRVTNYQKFKNKYLTTSGNFTLMVRDEYEMIEIKGVDVLVYIPEKPLSTRLGNVRN